MLNNFKEKRILFIGPIFHNYHVLIKEKLEFLGSVVDFYPERDYGWRFKIINNFFKSYLIKFQSKHYDSILKKCKEDYDILFVIRGYMFSDSFVSKFKTLNPKARTLFYQWDSNKTNPFLNVAPLFDKVCSFDFKDCSEFPFIKYLPLFYTDDVISFNQDERVVEYDFFFMGWYFAERYDAVVSFRDFAVTNNYKLKIFLYCPLSSYLKEMLKGNLLDRSIISFTPMKRVEYLTLLSKSKVMVDVSNPRQTGVAMRVIEAISLNVKVLTNNLNLSEDEIIGKAGIISFFDEKNVRFEQAILDVQSFEYSHNLTLSLELWLSKLFGFYED